MQNVTTLERYNKIGLETVFPILLQQWQLLKKMYQLSQGNPQFMPSCPILCHQHQSEVQYPKKTNI